MRFFSGTTVGLVLGFILGTFYALYQTVEASDSKLVSIMQSIKAIMEVF